MGTGVEDVTNLWPKKNSNIFQIFFTTSYYILHRIYLFYFLTFSYRQIKIVSFHWTEEERVFWNPELKSIDERKNYAAIYKYGNILEVLFVVSPQCFFYIKRTSQKIILLFFRNKFEQIINPTQKPQFKIYVGFLLK